ncbi:4-hydroxy-3-methylbut-2-enyl diphosphate reductase [Sphingosinicella sp. CPCC 101087]|uniref:4-hydroxy-3-methylbut-2-enyl diphosphate reductase n=1 Tax=Sphingosinicella sp. CPCC 101087 TaxID=2497754 RepID=UPI00101BBA57|nr:4-hydroxy-3-methylbut-2-enyl diphosphate reductase [Sphingosinicella sp. CPCC 101087]
MPKRIPASAEEASSATTVRGRLNVLLAAPRGFCAGVRRAIDAVEEALERFGPPVYVRRAIVHNLAVVRSLEAKGAIFIQELDEAPEGAVVILSAHGVARSVTMEAERLGLRHFDAVCPLVAKVHREVANYHRHGRHVVLIGHAGHPEIVGTLGQIPDETATVVARIEEVEALTLAPDAPVAYAVQTTYSVDDAAEIVGALKKRFSDIKAPASSDICYATTNRQAAVKQMVPKVDAIIVAGEAFSSNASRLAEVARAFGCPSVQLVANASHVDWALLEHCRFLGITAAASTPESTVQAIVEALRERFDIHVEEVGRSRESAVFKPMKIDGPARPGNFRTSGG